MPGHGQIVKSRKSWLGTVGDSGLRIAARVVHIVRQCPETHNLIMNNCANK